MPRYRLNGLDFSDCAPNRDRGSAAGRGTCEAMQNVRLPIEATPVGEAIDVFVASDRGGESASARRHFLFVSGPFGGLSRHVGRSLRQAGARATRVLLSVGDVVDWGLGDSAVYRGRRSAWAAWIDDHIAREAVTDLVVFGDSHSYCLEAMAAAKRRGLRIHVLEEGYFRPHWITLERDGVNGASGLPRNPEFYRQMAMAFPTAAHVPVGKITPAAVANISIYHTAQVLGAPLFPHYRAPSPLSADSIRPSATSGASPSRS